MVPYIGIVFIPFTVGAGLVGLGFSLRQIAAGGAKLSLVSIGLSFVVLALQIFLWWLLYIVPELGRTF